MADQAQLAFLMTFDAETGALKVVRQELEGAGEAAGKAGNQVKGFGAKLGGLGELAKTVSLGAFFLDAVKSAAGASDSLDDLHKTFQETIGVLVRQFEPAIKFVSQGLQGLLVTIQGLGAAVKAIFAGNFAEAAELAADAISAGGERVKGLTSAIEKDLSKIIVNETKIRLDNVKLSAEEKLVIIEDGERRAIQALRKSAEFQIMDEEARALAILEIQRGFSRERESAERSITSAQEKAAEDRKKIAEKEAETQRQIQEIGLQERLDLLSEAMARQLEVIGLSHEEKLAAVQDFESQEFALIEEARQRGILSLEQFEKAKSNIRQTARRTRGAIEKGEAADAMSESVAKAKAILAIEHALASRIVSLAFESAEKGKFNAREAARDIVKTVAQASANQILAYYAVAAGKEVASKGLIGLPIAAGLMATGAVLAAGVAALGGAAVRAIGGGGGGGGGGEGGPSPVPFPDRSAAEAQRAQEVASMGGPSGAPTTLAEGAAGASGARPVNVFLSMLDGTMAPEAATNVAAEVAKATR